MLSATHGTAIYCAASASALAQSYAEMLAPQPLQTRTSNTPALTLLRTPLPRRREKKEEDARLAPRRGKRTRATKEVRERQLTCPLCCTPHS